MEVSRQAGWLSNASSFSTHSINPAALNHSRGSVFRPFQLLSKPRSRPQQADKPNPGSGIYVYTYTLEPLGRVCARKENGGGGGGGGGTGTQEADKVTMSKRPSWVMAYLGSSSIQVCRGGTGEIWQILKPRRWTWFFLAQCLSIFIVSSFRSYFAPSND